MQKRASAVLDAWDADLAIAGKVMESGEVLRLWFVPRLGEGTLDRGDDPYTLQHVTLGSDFHDDLVAQLTATALAAVGPVHETTKHAAESCSQGYGPLQKNSRSCSMAAP